MQIKTNSIVAKGMILLLIFSMFSGFSGFRISNAAGINDWIIDGDKVYIDDENVYLSAEPHTIIESTWVEFTLISKQYTGDIDVVWGFNHSVVRPKQPQRWNGTAYNNWSKEFITRNVEFGGCNKWYILTELPVVEDVEYKVRAWMHVVFNTTGKYWFAVKPSSETLQQAIANGHLYYLDPWWDNSWTHYRTLTIESDYIGSTLNNFPCLVIIPTEVGSIADGGDSIRFLATDHATEWDYEIELWDGASDSFVWVEIPEILSGTDTEFYMYYNNTAASDNQNPTGVWDSNFISVYHGGDWTDATSNYYNLTTGGSPSIVVSQQIGSGMDFTGSATGDYVFNGTYYDVASGGDSYTIECWINVDASDAANRYAAVFIAPEVATANQLSIYPLTMPGNYQAVINDDVGDSTMTSTTTGQLNQYYYLASTFTSASGSLRVNASSEDTYVGQTHDFTDLTETNITLGLNIFNADWLNGQLDEIRVSKSVRTADWLNACFHNQNRSTHLGDFLDMGIETNFSVSIYAYTPSSGSENISTDYINTSLSATVNHTLGKNMIVNFYSNSEGSWVLFASNTTSGNETCYATNANFTGNGTIYYWNFSVEEDTNITDSNTYWFRTWYVPENPTNISSIYATPNLNITWTTGKYADSTVVVRNNASLPTSPTDGYEAYNGTLEYYNDSDVQNQTYFMLYSYNSTRNIYSSGASVDWGGIDIAVFNESDNSAIASWDLFVTNQSGSETYSATGLTNRHVVGYDLLPLGTDIDVRISADGYETRSYYVDLSVGVYYILNAYLPSENNSNFYVLIVTDEYDLPVENAKIEIKQYINESIGYTDVSTLYTDASGSVSVYLIPDVIQKYKVIISKTGYITEETNYIPDPNFYGIYYPKYFKISAEEPEIVTKTFGDICTFTGEWISTNNTLRVYFYDDESSTTDITIWIYESYNDTLTWKEVHTYGSESTVTFYNSSTLNTSRMHKLYLEMNHTTLGHVTNQVRWVSPLQPDSGKIRGDWINQILTDGFGAFSFDYVNFFLIFLPCILIIVLGGAMHHPGLGVVIVGGYTALFNWRVLVDNAAVLSILITLFFLIGFIVIISKKGRGLIK